MEWRTLRKIKQSPQHCRVALQSTKQDSVEGLAAHKQPRLGIMPHSWLWDLSLPHKTPLLATGMGMFLAFHP